jgi:predicted enzyme related to lactoylglutathione lyase
MTICESRTIGVSIDREWRSVYDFLRDPLSWPKWASGLGSDLERSDDGWTARGPDGPIRIRFAPPNEFGVLDHLVIAGSGAEVFNPMRVMANGTGSEIAFTLFRRPGMSAAQFAADADWVTRDLRTLKELLETQSERAHATEGGIAMAKSDNDRRIDNIEFNVTDIARSRAFYGKAFGWTFKDFGPTYCEFSDGRLVGGLTTHGAVKPGGPLVILYADDLAATQKRLEEAGARIVKPAFAFPGGRRFHFTDPDGYELAVWSDK